MVLLKKGCDLGGWLVGWLVNNDGDISRSLSGVLQFCKLRSLFA